MLCVCAFTDWTVVFGPPVTHRRDRVVFALHISICARIIDVYIFAEGNYVDAFYLSPLGGKYSIDTLVGQQILATSVASVEVDATCKLNVAAQTNQ